MGKTPQVKKLEGVIKGLERELEQLTPHPDQFSTSISSKIPQLTAAFNHNGLQMQAYLQNMPRRMGLQRRLIDSRRRLATLLNSHIVEGLSLAA